jgi:hypothetical protein
VSDPLDRRAVSDSDYLDSTTHTIAVTGERRRRSWRFTDGRAAGVHASKKTFRLRAMEQWRKPNPKITGARCDPGKQSRVEGLGQIAFAEPIGLDTGGQNIREVISIGMRQSLRVVKARVPSISFAPGGLVERPHPTLLIYCLAETLGLLGPNVPAHLDQPILGRGRTERGKYEAGFAENRIEIAEGLKPVSHGQLRVERAVGRCFKPVAQCKHFGTVDEASE